MKRRGSRYCLDADGECVLCVLAAPASWRARRKPESGIASRPYTGWPEGHARSSGENDNAWPVIFSFLSCASSASSVGGADASSCPEPLPGGRGPLQMPAACALGEGRAVAEKWRCKLQNRQATAAARTGAGRLGQLISPRNKSARNILRGSEISARPCVSMSR